MPASSTPSGRGRRARGADSALDLLGERRTLRSEPGSNVLNGRGRVAPGTAARVRAAIDELGFVRNDAARQLRAGRSRTIGLIVLEASNPFFADVARGAKQRARGAGMFVLQANSDDDPMRERDAVALFAEQRVAGVIVSPADDIAHLEQLVERGIQVVLVERATESHLSSVTVDNVPAGDSPSSTSSRGATGASRSSADRPSWSRWSIASPVRGRPLRTRIGRSLWWTRARSRSPRGARQQEHSSRWPRGGGRPRSSPRTTCWRSAPSKGCDSRAPACPTTSRSSATTTSSTQPPPRSPSRRSDSRAGSSAPPRWSCSSSGSTSRTERPTAGSSSRS